MLIAVAAWNAPKAEAATVSSKAAVAPESHNSRWEISGNKFKYNVNGKSDLKDCLIYIPEHYYFTREENGENINYRIIGGTYYLDKSGYISLGTDGKLIRTCYTIDANSGAVKKTALDARVVSSEVSSGGTFRGKTEIYSWNNGSISLVGKIVKDPNDSTGVDSANFQWKNAPICFKTEHDGKTDVFLVPNASGKFKGPAADGRIWDYAKDSKTNKVTVNKLYTGYALKEDGKMYRVASGKVASTGYTGIMSGYYYDYNAKKFNRKTSAITYKNGLPVSGWVISGSLTYGYYKNGILDQSLNYWCKNKSNGKWYYFEKGRIYRTGKKGPAKKKLKTTRLNYWGHGKASPGSYRYYLNADGSLVTNVFDTDSSWYKKKMRIYVNAKAGIDNVTFLGYIKGSGYCVPLKTIVTTCSRKNKTLKKQVRGAGGKGKWKLGRKGGSRHRWYLFHKNGNTYYYQYATSILGSGALFHSPRFLRHNIHSLYKPHFNEMGKKNITTKCVRIQVKNALMVYNISKRCKKYNYVSFIRKGRSKKTAYLPFGITELEDAIGQKTWDKNYDPSDPAIK